MAPDAPGVVGEVRPRESGEGVGAGIPEARLSSWHAGSDMHIFALQGNSSGGRGGERLGACQISVSFYLSGPAASTAPSERGANI